MHWGVCIKALIAMIVVAATETAFAKLMQPLFDKGFTEQNKLAILLIPILVILIFLVRGLASYINETSSTWLSATIVEEMRSLMFNKLLKLPISYYDQNQSGRILSRIIFDVTQITEAGLNVLTVSIRDGLMVIGLLGLLLYTDWQLTIFCLVTLPFILILVRILAFKLRKLSSNNQQQYAQMTQIVTEVVSGQRVVKLFNGNAYEQNRFASSINAIKTNNVKQTATSSLNSGLSQFLLSCGLAMILYFAASKAKNSNFTAGDFASFITSIVLILAPVKRITNVTQSLQKGIAAAFSVFEFLDNLDEEDNGSVLINGVNQSICLKNIIFRYLTKYTDQSNTTVDDKLVDSVSELKTPKNILDDVSLEIKAGSIVALVGSSGSGKTSLVNLIPRFYTPISGDIMIDNIDIKDIKLSSLRDNISLVSQDVVLFNDTIYNNIAYGNQLATYEAVEHAAMVANALEFIDDLPEGFNTYVGENGIRLSGGQKQRIAIARAILKDAPILILDEATSALDNQSEKLVQEALDYLMYNNTSNNAKTRTIVVIAHRLSTVIKADNIIVMDAGKIVESGTHHELLELNKIYAHLYNIQGFNLEVSSNATNK